MTAEEPEPSIGAEAARQRAEQGVDPFARWTAETVRYSTVARLVDAGFELGGFNVTRPCPRCGHDVRAHVVAMPASMAEGGWIECPEDDCDCHATWGIPQLQEPVVHRFRDRGNGQCMVCGRQAIFHPAGQG